MIKVKQEQIRSNEENSYFHAVLVQDIAGFQRWTPAQAKAWIKITFNVISTAGLTTIQFEELCENVREHVKKYWDLEISKPNQ